MKKIVYTLAIAVLGFASCESSLEDTFDELGTPVNDFAVGENEYKLTEEDYETLLADDEGDFEQYFSAIGDAEVLIPNILDELYPGLDNGSLTNVTFNLLDNVFPVEFVSTVSDYQEVFGEEKEFLSGIDDIDALLKNEFPQAIVGDYVNISYQSLGEIVSYTLTEDDYGLVGNGSNLNFDIRTGGDEEQISVRIDKISQILIENFPNSFIGQRYSVTYDAFADGFIDMTLVITVQFNGNNYTQVESLLPEYTLIDPSDYNLIGNALINIHPDAAANMLRFGNFDRRDDEDGFWSDEMIEDGITIVLNENFTDAVTGDKYQVTFDTFNEGFIDGVETFFFEKDANDNYFISVGELNVLSVVEILAFDGLNWVYPRTFTDEEYELMGRSFPNFTDETVALNNIGVFLNSQLIEPEGTISPVVYEFFDFTTSVSSSRYTTFEFIDRQWIGKAIVTENSIQFGKENGIWVPDNTILYTLIDSVDYDAIVASELADNPDFSDQISSMDRNQNFDRREADDAFWNDQMIIEALGIFLNGFDSDAAVGQKYNVTFNTWNPGDGVETFNLIKTEEGWVSNQ